MERLNSKQKDALRFLVKSSREGVISDEFYIYWTDYGPAIGTADGQEPAPLLTPITMDILTEEGLVYSRAHHTSTTSTTGGGMISDKQSIQYTSEDYRACCIMPDGYRAVDADFAPVVDINVSRPPVEITNSLANFRRDFPDPTRMAFVMMQFGSSDAHDKILTGIKDALSPHRMIAIRADEKQYHDDLYFNILTYLHGCRFGIAVFERIQDDSFNPNVSLEVGYMTGLDKAVCFLKDQTLQTLQTDLVGKLYQSFDPQNPKETIPPELLAWMDQKGFIVRQ